MHQLVNIKNYDNIKMHGMYVKIMWKLCENYVKILWKLCENYVNIVWKLCENYVKIVWKLCKCLKRKFKIVTVAAWNKGSGILFSHW